MSRRAPEQVRIMQERGFIAIREAARICGVTENAVHRWRREDGLATVKVGCFRYVDLKSLIAKFGEPAATLLHLHDHLPSVGDAKKR
jgi:hypothetical protein